MSAGPKCPRRGLAVRRTGGRAPVAAPDGPRAEHLWWEGRPTGRAHQEQAIDHYAYLALMGLCLLLTLPLEFVFGARVYRRFRTLVLALLPEVVVFTIWDIAGIARHHWTYNPRYVTGWRLPFRMPVEELVFFVVVPICGVLTYEAVGVVLGRVRRLRSHGTGRRRARA